MDEKIIFQIILDQVAAAKNLGELKKQLNEMVKNLPTDKDSEGFKIMAKGAQFLGEEIKKLESAAKNLGAGAAGEVQKSFKQIQKATGDLLMSWKEDFHDMSKMQESSKNWSDYKKQIEETKGAIDKITVVNDFWKAKLAEGTAHQHKHTEVVKKTKEEIEAERKEKEKNRLETHNANQILKQNIIIENASAGSVELMRAQLALVTNEWKKLSETERENSDRGKELTETKLKLTNQLKELEAATGDTRRNVGNYTNTIISLQRKIEDLTKTSATMDIGSDEFKDAQEEIKRLKVQIGQAQGVLDSFGRSTKNSALETTLAFGKFTGGAIAGISSLNIILGENKDTEKALLQVTQAIQIVQSVRAVTEGILASKTVLLTIATGAQAIATKALELAQRGLNAAMNSNPIIAIITGITTLIALLAGSSVAFASETKEVSKNNEELEKAIKNYDALNDVRDSAFEKRSDLDIQLAVERNQMSQHSADLLKINNDYRNDLFELNKKQKEEFNKLKEEFDKGTIKSLEELQAKAKELNERTADASIDLEVAKNNSLEIKNIKHNKEIAKQNEEAAKKREEENKKLSELKQKQFDDDFNRIAAELERQSDLDHEAFQAKVAAEAERIQLEIATLKDGDEQKLTLRLQTLATQRDAELALVTSGSQEAKNINEKFRQDEIAAKDEHFKVIRDKVATDNAERLAAELVQLELAGQSTTAKQIEIENAEFERKKNELILEGKSTETLKLQHENNLTAIQKKSADDRASITAKEFQLTKNILNAYASLGEIMASNEEEAAEFAKGVALFNIGLSTAQAIAQMAAIAKGATPIDYAIQYAAGIAVILANIASAKKLIVGNPKAPELQKFNDGNIAFEGGNIPSWGGMITGRAHSQNGVKFSMGNKTGEADGKKGEAYIINTGHDPFLKAAASAINVAGGGKSFYDWGGALKFQDGGFASRSATSTSDFPQQIADAIGEKFAQLPPVIATIEDINSGQDRVMRIQDRVSV